MTPDQLLSSLMGEVKTALFVDLPDQAWFQQQHVVKKALTLPAAWLAERGVVLPSHRYRQVVQKIIHTIVWHGRPNKGVRPSAYLYACVESHLRHHGDEYYEEGKSIRNRLKLVLSDIARAKVGADTTVPVLAQVHAALDAGKRKPTRKPSAPALQADLFADAKPVQIARLRAPRATSAPNCENRRVHRPSVGKSS